LFRSQVRARPPKTSPAAGEGEPTSGGGGVPAHGPNAPSLRNLRRHIPAAGEVLKLSILACTRDTSHGAPRAWPRPPARAFVPARNTPGTPATRRLRRGFTPEAPLSRPGPRVRQTSSAYGESSRRRGPSHSARRVFARSRVRETSSSSASRSPPMDRSARITDPRGQRIESPPAARTLLRPRPAAAGPRRRPLRSPRPDRQPPVPAAARGETKSAMGSVRVLPICLGERCSATKDCRHPPPRGENTSMIRRTLTALARQDSPPPLARPRPRPPRRDGRRAPTVVRGTVPRERRPADPQDRQGRRGPST